MIIFKVMDDLVNSQVLNYQTIIHEVQRPKNSNIPSDDSDDDRGENISIITKK